MSIGDLGWPIIIVDAFFVCEDTVFTLKIHFHLHFFALIT